jgi:hypothetical protein
LNVAVKIVTVEMEMVILVVWMVADACGGCGII